jgi:uncharacterized lipoprotein YddW (UPF0748 family)
MHHLLIMIIALLATTRPAAPTTPAPPRDFRGLWVTRWDYRSPADVKRVFADIATLGVTDVFWQVRGQADAFYKSDLEPWGRELFRDLPPGANDPGYDPLGLAVKEAHARGLHIHAWFNVMPMWKGTEPPTDPRQLFNAHPDWRLYDAKGVPQALNEHYVIVNPIYPEVQDYIVAVAKDIMTRYAVDGLHMDYVRFVSETMKDAAAYPGDARSIDLFRKATGRAGVTSKDDQAAYRVFIRQRITDLVRRIKKEAVGARPGAVLTGAVWRRPELATDAQLQDAPLWLKEGTMDRALPMIYQDKNEQFESDLKAWIAAVGKDDLPRLSPGIASYKHTPKQTPDQIQIARGLGVSTYSVFAYASLFESVDPNQSRDPAEIKLRADRRRELIFSINAK